MIRFTFLGENKTDSSAFIAEHGLSIYIETEEMNILFDTSASGVFAENAKRKNIVLSEADACVISHGHYDHAGGVPLFCKINQNAPVYIHKDAFKDFHGVQNGKIKEKGCGIPWQLQDIEKGRIKFTDGVKKLSDNILISGTIPDFDSIEKTEPFYIKEVDGSYSKDDMNHEQFLIIRNGNKGIFIFSGCSHKGIIPVVEYAKKLFPNEKIGGVIAGMHLYHSEKEIKENVAHYLKELDADVIMPVHCTGIDAICRIRSIVGETCIPAVVGDTYEY